MSDEPVELDRHRGMAAQKATELRRLVGEVAADQRRLKERQDELETALVSARSATWAEAAHRVRYLLLLFAATPTAEDPRRQKLIVDLLEDLDRLQEAGSLATPGPDKQQ